MLATAEAVGPWDTLLELPASILEVTGSNPAMDRQEFF
jgi:hypothetical protein